MNARELKKAILSGGMEQYSAIYADTAVAGKRLADAVDSFTAIFGDRDDIAILSVPGRSEIIGNHTDHNRGKVLAGAIDRDIIAVVSKNSDGIIRFHSEGYTPDVVNVLDTHTADNFEKYTSAALIGGVVNGFEGRGYAVGGFDCYSNTEVLKGSGISSSAAYEVMIGNILNHLYNGGRIDNKELAHIAQYAENKFFGKPCGLMDQMACAVGGFVYIDFADAQHPVVEPISFAIGDKGYALSIVNTGGNHADLNEDYASVPREMRAVAAAFGRDALRGVTEADILPLIPTLRETLGDRAILRALHFLRENDRVTCAADALKNGDVDTFLHTVKESGRSSFEYLQNVYTNINVKEQGLSLALCLTDGFLGGEGAFRVHGGGFAGTVQVFLPKSRHAAYNAYINSVFGEGAAMTLNIRPVGAVRLF